MLALIAAVHARMSKERPPQASGDADQLKPRSQRAQPSFRGTPAEVYVLGGSHTRKAAAAGRLLCSVLGTQQCHLTDGLWVDNVSAPSLLKRMRVPPELQHIYPPKKLGTLNAHFDAWGAISEQGRSSSKEWAVFLEDDAMLNSLLPLGSAENVKHVVPMGLEEALCSRAAVKRGLVYLGRCSNSLKLPNATALPPDSCAESTPLLQLLKGISRSLRARILFAHTHVRYPKTCGQRSVLKSVCNVQRLLFPQMHGGSGVGRVHKSHKEAPGRGGPARAEEATHVHVIRRPLHSAEGTILPPYENEKETVTDEYSPKNMRARAHV